MTRIDKADTFAKRLLGLMFRKSVPDGYALLFENCSAIHTHFMRCAIDVVYLDEAYKALGVETLTPWKIGHSPAGTRHVLECAAGQASAFGYRVDNATN